MEYGTYQLESQMASAGAPRPMVDICPNVAGNKRWAMGITAEPSLHGHIGFTATARRPKEDSS